MSDRQREQVERIEVSARHLLQLIEEILTMTSVEAGHARVGNQKVELEELLRRAEIIVRPMALDKEIRLVVDPVEPVVLETDPDKLLQVLLNLLSNAIKFTERGQVRVRARADGRSVLMEVADTGIGLTPEQRAHVFDPFWQAEEPITRRAGGTGLGLTITRRLLDLLGGQIEVESEVDRGSTFRVRVPLRPPPP